MINNFHDVWFGEKPPKRRNIIWLHHSTVNDLNSPIVMSVFSNGKWVDVNSSKDQAQISGKGVKSIVNIDKEAFDALSAKDPETIYIVKDDPTNGHEWVDIGMVDDDGYHIVWATKNIGAENPWDAGKYFAWGDTVGYYADEGHDFILENTPYYDSEDEEYTKYNDEDGLTELQPGDDAAHVQWGGLWRMQTYSQYNKLVEDDIIFSDFILDESHNIKCIKYTNENNTCYIPMGGYIGTDSPSEPACVNEFIQLWASSIGIDPFFATDFYVDYNGGDIAAEDSMERYIGQTIRPIIKVKDLSELDPTYDIYLGENKVVDNSSKISDYDKSILDPGEDQYAYGVLIDFTQGKSSYDLTRIGNMDLHRTLPVQSQYKGCIWDLINQEIITYLNPQDWSLATEDKTAEEIDELLHDAQKSIRVETPKFYACSKVLATDGAGNTTMAKVMFSTEKLNPLYIEVPKMVTDFRPGRYSDDDYFISNMSIDDIIFGGYCSNKDSRTTGKEGLLHPITNFSRAYARTAASACNTHLFSYDAYKWIFYWAVVIEYATLFTAKPMIQELDENGFHQGGLGPGMTSIESYGAKYAGGSYIYNKDYDIQDSFYLGANYFQSDASDEFPLRDIGVTNNWGNRTGENIVEYTSDGITSHVHQNRYRGFEFPFGDIMMNLDGVLCVNKNGVDYYLTCKNPEHFADDIAESFWYDNENSEDWRIAGTIRKEYNSEDSYYEYPFTFSGYDESGKTKYANIGNEGDLIPQAIIQTANGNYPVHFVNQFYPIDADNNVDSPNTLPVGCAAYDGAVHRVGLGCFDAAGVDAARDSLGFRCFNIIED